MGGVERGRRNTGYWAPFNVWWRAHLEKHGERPKADDLKRWFLEESKKAFPHEPPTYTMIRNHAKGLRDIASVKNYFRDYRARKRRAVADLAGGPSPRSEASDDEGDQSGSGGHGSGTSGTDVATSEDDYHAAGGARRKRPDPHQQRRKLARAGLRSAATAVVAASAAGGSGQHTPPIGTSQAGSLLGQQSPMTAPDALGDIAAIMAASREQTRVGAVACGSCGPGHESLGRLGMDSRSLPGSWQPSQQQQLMQPRSHPVQQLDRRGPQDAAVASASGLGQCDGVLGAGVAVSGNGVGNGPQSSGHSPYRSSLPEWISDWRSLMPHEGAAGATAAATAATGSCSSAGGGGGEVLAQGFHNTLHTSPQLVGTPPLAQHPTSAGTPPLGQQHLCSVGTPGRRRSSASAAVAPPLSKHPQATAMGGLLGPGELAGRTSPSTHAVLCGGRGGVMMDANGLASWGPHLGHAQPLGHTAGGVAIQLSPSQQHPVSPLSDTAPSPSSAAVRQSTERCGMMWGTDGGLCSNLMSPGMAMAGGGSAVCGGGMGGQVMGGGSDGEDLGLGLHCWPRRVVESAPLRGLPFRMQSSPLVPAEGGPEAAVQSQVWTPFAAGLPDTSPLAESERQGTPAIAKESATACSTEETISSVHCMGRMQSLRGEGAVSTVMGGTAATPSGARTAPLHHSPVTGPILSDWAAAAAVASAWTQSVPPQLPPLLPLPECPRYSSAPIPGRTPFELEAFLGQISSAPAPAATHTAASAASPAAAFASDAADRQPSLPNLPTSFGDATPPCTTGSALYNIAGGGGGPTIRESSSPMTPTASRTAGPPPVTTGFMPSKSFTRCGSAGSGAPTACVGLPHNGLQGAGGSPSHGGLVSVPGHSVLTGACGPQLSGTVPPQSCAMTMTADAHGAAAAANAVAVAVAELGGNSSNSTPRSRLPASNSPPFGSCGVMPGNGPYGQWGSADANAPAGMSSQVWNYPAAAPAPPAPGPPSQQSLEPAGQHLQSGFPGPFSTAPSGPNATSLSPPHNVNRGNSMLASGGGGMPATCPPPARMRYVPYPHPHPRMPAPQGYYPRPYPCPPGARYPVGRYPPYPAPTMPFMVRRRHVSPPLQPPPQPPPQSYLMQDRQDNRFPTAGSGAGQAARDAWDGGRQHELHGANNNRVMPVDFAGHGSWGGATGYTETAAPQEFTSGVGGSAAMGGMSAAYDEPAGGLGGSQRYPAITNVGAAGTGSSYMYGSCATMGFDGVGQLAGPSVQGLVSSQPAHAAGYAGFGRDGSDEGLMGSLWAACADAGDTMGTYVSAGTGSAGGMGDIGGGGMYGQMPSIVPSYDGTTMRQGARLQDAHYWGSSSQGAS